MGLENIQPLCTIDVNEKEYLRNSTPEMCTVVRKIHHHPLPHFQMFLLSVKVATKSEGALQSNALPTTESALNAFYPQG